jgi:uncharacterized protein YaiI (UPF0178 family)
VVMVFCSAHEISGGEGVETVRVDNEPEAVDLAIFNRLEKGDLVVTQDYGLASMCLGKQARVLSPRGMEYTDSNIDRLEAQRHHARKIRRSKKINLRVKGPSAFSAEDRGRFTEALERALLASGSGETS